MHTSTFNKENNLHPQKCLCWSAILASALVASGLTCLFNLLTLGLGLSAYTHTKAEAVHVASGAFLWTAIGGFIVLFFSGLVAGKMAHKNTGVTTCHGMLHGFLAWTVYLLLSLAFISHLAESAAFFFPPVLVNISSPLHQAEAITLATFFTFLLGALGSSLGGYYGIKWCQKCRTEL